MNKVYRRCLLLLIVLFYTNEVAFAVENGTITLEQAKNEYKTLLSRKKGDYVLTSEEMVTKWGIQQFANSSDWEKFMFYCDEEARNSSPAGYAHFCYSFGYVLEESNYPHLAFQYYIYAENYVRSQDPLSIPYYNELNYRLAIIYYKFKRYDKCATYVRALLKRDTGTEMRIGLLNTLALVYRNTNQPEKSKEYFEKGLALAQKVNNKGWIGVINGNLGAYYYNKGDYAKAKELMLSDLNESVRTNQWESAMNAQMLLATISLENNNIEEAIDLMRKTEEMEARHYHPKNTSYLIHKFWTDIYEKTGDYTKAYTHQKLSLAYQDTIQKEQSIDEFNNMQFQMEFQRKQSEIRLLTSRKKRVEQMFFFSGIVVCVVLIGMFIVLRQVVLRRKKEKEVLLLQNLRIEDELRNTEEQMRLVLTNLGEKNELVSQLQSEIDRFQVISESITAGEKESLQDTLHSFKLLTEDDWDEFRRLFEKLNPGFLNKFADLSDSLSKADIRLAALIRLDHSFSQIGKILGISPESVKRTHLRLRKKLMIDQQKDLDDMIRSL